MKFYIQPSDRLQGRLRVPGDKSISHRSIMLGALANGTTEVNGFLEGADSLATLNAFKQLGVQIEGPEQGQLNIQGVGMHGLQPTDQPLDLGNSGTSMRLLAGLFCGQGLALELIGDDSLSKRPMRRITEPLSQMGAQIETSPAGTPPLRIHPVKILKSIRYALPIASAQVKSSILLAGLYAQGTTWIKEPAPTRDHTERMLTSFDYPVLKKDGWIGVQGGGQLKACTIDVPADISSAAFFMVGASIAPGSDIYLEHVGINPTRDGIIRILKKMGANIELLHPRTVGGEPVADIRVRYAQLKGIHIPSEWVPLAIDEFPALFIAAACAKGTTVLTDAAELRVKESDRIQVMAEGLQSLGIAAQPTPDGMIITGGTFKSAQIDSHGDHRIAMSFAMAGLRSQGPIQIEDCDNVNTSFPQFVSFARQAGLNIKTE